MRGNERFLALVQRGINSRWARDLVSTGQSIEALDQFNVEELSELGFTETDAEQIYLKLRMPVMDGRFQQMNVNLNVFTPKTRALMIRMRARALTSLRLGEHDRAVEILSELEDVISTASRVKDWVSNQVMTLLDDEGLPQESGEIRIQKGMEILDHVQYLRIPHLLRERGSELIFGISTGAVPESVVVTMTDRILELERWSRDWRDRLGMEIIGMLDHGDMSSMLALEARVEGVRDDFLHRVHLLNLEVQGLMNPDTLPGAAYDRVYGGEFGFIRDHASGGMAQIRLVEEISTHRLCVLKTPFSTSTNSLMVALATLTNEASILGSLDHANIPTLIAEFEEEGAYHVVMDYVEGETLWSRVQRDGPLDGAAVRDLAISLAGIVHYLHSRVPAIVHRDIKPANIIIGSYDDQVYLIDYGLAILYDPVPSSESASGTPGYIAPEVTDTGASPRSDLYSVGATLYFALTGASAPTDGDLIPPVAEALSTLAEVVGRLLDPEVERRPENAGVLLDLALAV